MIRQLLLLLCLSAFARTNAQSVSEIEDSTFHYMQSIKKYSQYNYSRNIDAQIDSLYLYHFLLSEYLKNKLSTQPLTLWAEFAAAEKEGLHVATSEDKKVRIYCWNEEGGGTMMSWNSIIQYATGSGTNAEIIYCGTCDSANEGNAGDFYSHIYTIHKKNNKPVYLAILGGRAWNSYGSRDIRAFAIENDTFNHSIKIFKKGKEYFNDIGYAYDLFLN